MARDTPAEPLPTDAAYCDVCGRHRTWFGYELFGRAVCRGCWLDHRPADELPEVRHD